MLAPLLPLVLAAFSQGSAGDGADSTERPRWLVAEPTDEGPGGERVPAEGAVLRTRDADGRALVWRTVEDRGGGWGGQGAAAFVAPLLAGRDGGWAAPMETIVVRAADRDPETARRAVERLMPWASARAVLPELPGTLRVDPGTPDGTEVLLLARRLAADPELEWAEPDWILHGRSSADAPDDPLFAHQWGLQNLGQSGGSPGVDLQVLSAWDTTRGSSAAGVLVIDVGVDLGHPDLNLGPAIDLTDDGGQGGPINVCDSHGTWVAGCVSALADNDLGVSGVAPESPVLSARALVAEVPLGFCNGSWTTVASWTAEALLWGRRAGARVSVNSNAYGFESKLIEAAYAETRASGMVHFASSGNFGEDQVTYPASLASVIAVGAIDAAGLTPGFSNGGSDLDLVAPGRDVWTTDRVGAAGGEPDGDFLSVDGTSFAAPLAAAAASLMLSVDPSLTADQVRAGLLGTARDLGPEGLDLDHGYGLVDAARGVLYASGAIDVLLSDTVTVSLAQGGSQVLALDAADSAAGAIYLVLGSASGTSPGLMVGDTLVPLVQDNWFELCLNSANAGVFGSTYGQLGRFGRATASLTLPGGLSPFLAGLTLRHTFVRVEPDGTLAEPPPPVPLRLVP